MYYIIQDNLRVVPIEQKITENKDKKQRPHSVRSPVPLYRYSGIWSGSV